LSRCKFDEKTNSYISSVCRVAFLRNSSWMQWTNRVTDSIDC